MATTTELTDRLTQINAAIDAIETGGQAVQVDDVSYTRANAMHLYRERGVVERRLSRLQGKRPWFQRVVFPSA